MPIRCETEEKAKRMLGGLAKPPGSLGRLESLCVQLAGIQGVCPPIAPRPRVVVFAGDHGITAEKISAYPSAVTLSMIETMRLGKAAVTVLARQSGADVEVVNAGASSKDFDKSQALPKGVKFYNEPVQLGTNNFLKTDAMDKKSCKAAIALGRAAVRRAKNEGVGLLAIGELGIGNTTSASALYCRLLGMSPQQAAGPGTGLDKTGVQHKVAVLSRALARTGAKDPFEVLCAFGGYEIAAMAGAMMEAAPCRIAVLVDGFISTAAALVASRMAPECKTCLIPATKSAEPAHGLALRQLDIGTPLLDWQLRLGEASGATLAIPLVLASVRPLQEMATLAEVLSAGQIKAKNPTADENKSPNGNP
uniref:Nicotinate-nucleotide--dimethylbenzimidazole phosphoribosyltransferase n=1 Tax=Lotharella oceanica TaxID=641309 RepID=A0A7S2TPW2_9EUKA|mmetsp:Transcript_21454/g.40196  ORF Transcript_21454/g.40196 Transcript_21454/m.40196 type:complete len:364 (+) Transcript_21454:63-1154(+)